MIDIPTLVQYIKTKIKFASFERNSTSFVYMCSFNYKLFGEAYNVNSFMVDFANRLADFHNPQ